MNVVDCVEHLIEDLLMLDGEATLLFRVAEADVPTWEIVFPMGQEVSVQRLLRKHQQTFRERLGPVYRVVPRTILYHLALGRFSTLAAGSVELVSTNIKNLPDPRSHSVKKFGTRWLGYDVDCIAVGRLSSGEMASFIEHAIEVTDLFNAASRYLRIERLGVSAVADRMAKAPKTISPVSLIQPPDAGIPMYFRDHFGPAR